MKLGSTQINKMFLGSTEIKKAYLGSTLVHDAAGGGGGGPVVPDPVFTVQPVDAVVALGANVVFTVNATGTEPITYQWWEFK